MDERAAMQRAIVLARQGLGRTSPNPVVGCVILDAAGEIVGEGWHQRAGQPHAEILALDAAGKKAYGATVIVTLEPCAHVGRTAPCVNALMEAGVGRVVVAIPDPNPIAGGGAEILQAAGIPVELGVLASEARALNIAWLTATRRARPYVTWKFAATLDGRSAAADGSSQWITHSEARLDVHRLRAQVDTMLVGVGTVLADDPALTVRLPDYQGPQPNRVVVDSYGRTPPYARVHANDAVTWIATTAELPAGADGRVDLAALMKTLYERGARSVLLEGGPTLAGAMLQAGLVDRVVAYLAPKLLGSGSAALGNAGITTANQALDLELTEIGQCGPDIRIIAELKESR